MRLTSLLSAAIIVTMAAGVIGAEQPAAVPASGGASADAVTVLDNNSLWRHFVVSRCAFIRSADGKLESWDLVPLGMGGA